MIGRALSSCIRVVLIESSGAGGGGGGGRVIFRRIHRHRKCTEAMGPKRRAFLLPIRLFSAHSVGETLRRGEGGRVVRRPYGKGYSHSAYIS